MSGIRRYVELDEAGLTGCSEVYRTSDGKLLERRADAELHQAELDLKELVHEKSCYSMNSDVMYETLVENAPEFAGLLQAVVDAKIAHERANE